ncbi:MAG: LysE family translocator [Deltaproteobacteria bacterium]|jgi:threonine/homoserine/homoserine lactone efflux protein|nr:LysE family translocator [Deltaproteobacteria bacterium]
MSLVSVLSFAIAIFVLALTPGPGVFAIISRSLASGFKTTLVMIVGCITGDIIFLLFAIMGMSAIAQTMGTLFLLVKIVGAAYLIFLGIKIWISKPVPVNQQQINGKKAVRYGNYLSGLGITLSNPKVILFYCGFLPTFMDLPSMTGFDIIIVTTVLAMVLSVVLISYAYLASSARLFFSSTRSVKWLNRTAGTVMISAGAAIAAKS